MKNGMDSGLGSDEDRRGRTKEQKQLHNQQLLSGCFIDAASLSDDAEVVDQRRSDERRQGALLFQTSVPHFSMLQMSNSTETRSFSSVGNLSSNYPESSTPYNSIIQLDLDEPETSRKSPLGFYVDLSDVAEAPKTPPSASATKNIFSMVIDFEAPKKDKPTKLSSSFTSFRRSKPLNKSNLVGKCQASSSLSSSVSSVNSTSIAGTSRQSEEQEMRRNSKEHVSIEVLSASLVKNLSVSSKSSSSSENMGLEKSNEDLGRNSAKESVEEAYIDQDNDSEKVEDDNSRNLSEDHLDDVEKGHAEEIEDKVNKPQVS